MGSEQPTAASDPHDPLQLAAHYEQSGNSHKAARFYQLAGKKAFYSYANDTALYCFNRALTLTPFDRLEARYELMMSREWVFSLSSQPEARSDNLTGLAMLADELDDDIKRADVAARLALYKLDNGEPQDAISIARLAVRIAQYAQAYAAEAGLLVIWGRALFRLDNYDMARERFQQALVLAGEHGLKDVEAACRRFLGVLSEMSGQYEAGVDHYLEALNLYRLLQDQRGQSDVLNNLGKVAFDRGQFTQALAYWDQARGSYEAIGDEVGSCRLLANQCAGCLNMGDYKQGKVYGEAALDGSRAAGVRFGECLTLINMSLIHHYEGEYETGLTLGQAALGLAVAMGSRRLEGYAQFAVAKSLAAQGQVAAATTAYWETLAVWEELQLASLVWEVEVSLGALRLQAGDVAGALVQVETAVSALLRGAALDGTESPFAVYLTCYRVLAAAGDERASAVLRQGYWQLQERAAAIADEAARRVFLENVAANQQLVAAFLALPAE